MADNLIDNYQEFTRSTAVYPSCCGDQYTIMGLANEAGEVAGAYKKYLRGDYDELELIERIKKELGDVMWYIARVADEFELELSGILIANRDKLIDRQNRNAIKGDGDDR